MKLNCDMGESFGAWTLGDDAGVMPFIDMANIACGFHASDPVTMAQTVSLAKASQVMIGAHPGYPDLVGFGRRNMTCSPEEISQIIVYQVGALAGMCSTQGVAVEYVKPHGALYNQMMRDEGVMNAVIKAVSLLNSSSLFSLKLVVQACIDAEELKQRAAKQGVALMFEAFLDRGYDDDGLLVPRNQPNALITQPEALLARLDQLLATGSIQSVSGHVLSLCPDTLCVHGDSPASIALIEQMQRRVSFYNHQRSLSE